MSEPKDLNKEAIRAWVAALRSNKYTQGKGYLRKDGNYCCLGVACLIYANATQGEWVLDLSDLDEDPSLLDTWAFVAEDGSKSSTQLPEAVSNYYGVNVNPRIGNNYKSRSLTAINDTGKTFSEIADLIEQKYLAQ